MIQRLTQMAVLVFLATQAQAAQLSPTLLELPIAWDGTLAMTDSDGETNNCEATVGLSIEPDEVRYRQILSGYCDWHVGANFERKGDDLFQNGKKVGEITVSRGEQARLVLEKAQIFTPDGDWNFRYDLDARISETGDLILNDRTAFSDELYDTMTGTLAPRVLPFAE